MLPGGVTALAIHDSKLFAGIDLKGVYVADLNDMEWKAANEGLENETVSSFVFDKDYVFVGTYGYGVWKRPISEAVGIKEEKGIQQFQIFPNPSNGTFMISSSESIKNATITIYTIIGEKVYMDSMNSSQKTINCKLNPGCYIIKVEENGKPLLTHKILLQ
jgi:hypothetical protein